ncbi:hypothetical protein N7492_002847 [Penicillium capsulatum]|uniref:Wings apart-like protein C-terminal domain-containing protein n=1 Tax=Penicillium capsulatum TaxID=69766 RepID=A0A9W9IKV6_9EURO|nr:hypothetical protein N7492_002847 [Penicillium capsulatum]KAJ6122556.1 hypothetical protein N7512_005021 [Penicillium capsulatum]
MEPARPRSRRLTTYGSSAKNPPKSKTAHARPPTLQGPKDSSGGSSRPGISNRKGLNNGKEDGQPSGPNATTDVDIYDMPSSDDEEKLRVIQRKRRRRGPADNSLQNDSIESTCSAMIEKGGSAKRPNAVDSRHGKGSSSSKKTPDTPQPRRKKTGGVSQPNSNRLPTAAASGGVHKPLHFDLDLHGHTSKNHHDPKASRTGQARNCHEPSHLPRSPNRTVTIDGNATPSRRRLIDSLGTSRARSADAPSSEPSPNSQMSSPLAPRTPTRLADAALQDVPTAAQPESQGADPNSALSPHVTGSRVTYARQRSFLDDLALAESLSVENAPGNLDRIDPPIQYRGHQSMPRAHALAAEEANEDDGSVRSIHELRRAGGNARYRGAIESMLEDIEDTDNSVSGRCNSLIQLCGKLLDSKFARQFIECGFDKRLVDLVSLDVDIVSATLLLCAFNLSSLNRILPYLIATTAWPRLLETSLSLLSYQDELHIVARTKDHQLSKPVQKLLQNITPKLKSAFLGDVPSLRLSPCLIVLQCLRTTVSAFQAKGETPNSLPTPWVRQLVSLLRPGKPLRDGQSDHEAERSQLLILGLSILEAHTVSQDLLQQEQCDILRLLGNMHDLLGCEENEPDMIDQQIRSLYLRVILNVTNTNPTLCDDFATPTMIEELVELAVAKFDDLTVSVSQENNLLDTVILALGTLINLAEKSEASRVYFLDPTYPTTTSHLSRLLRIFLKHVDSMSKAHSVREVHHNVAVGYLAVLLLALCLHPEARSQVKESLSSNGLAVVMSTVDEFLQYHRKIEQELHPFSAGENSGFHGRLQDLVSQIQRNERDME